MNAKDKLRVGVIMGGPSTEHGVSLESGTTMIKYLDKSKYLVRPIIITKEDQWCVEPGFLENDDFSAENQVERGKNPGDSSATVCTLGEVFDKVFKTELDFALIAMHGPFGEDGTLQGILDYAKVPYNGSGVMTSALAMDKIMCKAVYEHSGIPTPAARFVTPEQWREDKAAVVEELNSEFGFPVVLKIARSGSSYGVDIPLNNEELKTTMDGFVAEGDPVLVEQYVKGREFSCGVLEKTGDDGGKEPLPIVEIRPKKSLFFDTTAKYDSSASEEIVPAKIDGELKEKVERIALTAHDKLRCSVYSRTDVLLSEKDGNLYAIETNTLPGFAVNSLYPKEAIASGMTVTELLDKIILASMTK